MDLAACPKSSELRALAVGDLPAERLARLLSHVQTCDRCTLAVAGLDAVSDDLVERLRTITATTSCLPPSVPPALADAARRAQYAPTGLGEGREWVVDAGRRIASRVAKGAYKLDYFELQEEIGRGSFGYVFRALDTRLQRTVAVKVERATPHRSPEGHDRFLGESRSIAHLSHTNIVSLYGIGETEEGVRYLVTEFVRGETLEDRLSRGRPDARLAAKWIADLGSAVHYAHEHGVVHRDIKPSNVMLDAADRPHLMDFGLAKQEAEETNMTPHGAVIGTPAYMSPEIAKGNSRRVDARTDIYSLGVMLYEMLAGTPPFRGSHQSVLLAVLEQEPRSLRQLDDSIPRDLETICHKAMAKLPDHRYVDADRLVSDLIHFLRDEPIAARPPGAMERLRRWSRKNPLAASLIATVAVSSSFGFWHLSRLSDRLWRESALESAGQYSGLLEVVNDLYASAVVARVGGHDIDVIANYLSKEDAIPLPSTLLTELLQRVSEGDSGMLGRHYSAFPFRGRTDGGPHDDFEREALTFLSSHPDQVFHRFGDDAHGRPVLRHATARIMAQSCVDCHNSHPDSTRHDWRTGDVRGVLEIIRPVDRDVARVRSGLRSSFVMVAVITVALLGLAFSVLFLRQPAPTNGA